MIAPDTLVLTDIDDWMDITDDLRELIEYHGGTHTPGFLVWGTKRGTCFADDLKGLGLGCDVANPCKIHSLTTYVFDFENGCSFISGNN